MVDTLSYCSDGLSPCCVACENIQLWCHALFKVLQWGASPVCCWFFVLGEVSHAFQLGCEYTEVVFLLNDVN